MMRIFMGPGLYVQGPGAIDTTGTHIAQEGRDAILVCDSVIRPLIEARLQASLRRQGMRMQTLEASGEVTAAAIISLSAQIQASGADIVLGSGGGRVLDMAKGAALVASLPFVSIPTIASSDAPASRGVPVLSPDLDLLEVRQMPRNPLAVIVDTGLIAAAPLRFFVAGMGDALSKHFEAEACYATQSLNKHGTPPLLTGRIIAAGCLATIRRNGVAALMELRRGSPGLAVEHVVEAVVLMSCLAFENTGLAIAHAIAPALVTEGDGGALHGEHAAYGTLVQVAFENRPEAELADLISFCREVGLPVSLTAFAQGAAPSAIAEKIAAKACTIRHVRNQSQPVTPDTLAAAMMRLERIAAP